MKLLIILICSLLIADTRFSGEAELTSFKSSIEHSKSSKREETIAMIVLKPKIEYSFEGFSLNISSFLSAYASGSGNKLYNENQNAYCDNYKFFFRELYGKYSYGKHSFGFGLLPFSTSSFNEFQDDYVKTGEGLTTIVDANFVNFFYLYKNDSIVFKTGLGEYSWLNVPKGEYIDPNNSESWFGWISLEYNYEKFKSYTTLIAGEGKYKGISVADIYLLANGFSYDDSEYSGLVLYNIIAGSLYKNHNTKVQDMILESQGIPAGALIMSPNNFGFNNNRYIGWSNLMGIRKDFDFAYEPFINIEWFRTSDNWFSLNNGNAYSPVFDANSFNVRNNSYLLSLGIRPSESLLIRLYISKAEFNKVSQIGLPPVTIPYGEAMGDRKTSSMFTRVVLKYRF